MWAFLLVTEYYTFAISRKKTCFPEFDLSDLSLNLDYQVSGLLKLQFLPHLYSLKSILPVTINISKCVTSPLRISQIAKHLGYRHSNTVLTDSDNVSDTMPAK